MTTSVVIAGGGTVITRFVVPALLNAGVAPDRLFQVADPAETTPEPALQVRRVSGWDALPSLPDTTLTVNCAGPATVAAAQQELLRRFPLAAHFSDSLPADDAFPLRTIVRLARERVMTLHAWPYMPNVAFFLALARQGRDRAALSFEHSCGLESFLAVYRTVLGAWRPSGRALVAGAGAVAGRPRPWLRARWNGPDDVSRARIAWRTRECDVEDYFEVEASSHDDAEVLYRVVDDRSVRYHLGSQTLWAGQVQPALLAAYGPFRDRNHARDLDAFIGLSRLFRGTLEGTDSLRYPQVAAARDAATVRRLVRRGRSHLL